MNWSADTNKHLLNLAQDLIEPPSNREPRLGKTLLRSTLRKIFVEFNVFSRVTSARRSTTTGLAAGATGNDFVENRYSNGEHVSLLENLFAVTYFSSAQWQTCGFHSCRHSGMSKQWPFSSASSAFSCHSKQQSLKTRPRFELKSGRGGGTKSEEIHLLDFFLISKNAPRGAKSARTLMMKVFLACAMLPRIFGKRVKGKLHSTISGRRFQDSFADE